MGRSAGASAAGRWWGWVSWPEITVSVLVLAAGAAVFLHAHRDEGTLRESKTRGAVIVRALEQHRADHGEYPQTLDALVPAYLAAIEPPTWGLHRWKYQRYVVTGRSGNTGGAAGDTGAAHDTQFFTLSVAASEAGYPLLFYDHTARRWTLNN